MANMTNINIRIDKDLKERAEMFFSELGLTMTSAFNIFVRQSLIQGKIPFELRREASREDFVVNNPSAFHSLRGILKNANISLEDMRCERLDKI